MFPNEAIGNEGGRGGRRMKEAGDQPVRREREKERWLNVGEQNFKPIRMGPMPLLHVIASFYFIRNGNCAKFYTS